MDEKAVRMATAVAIPILLIFNWAFVSLAFTATDWMGYPFNKWQILLYANLLIVLACLLIRVRKRLNWKMILFIVLCAIFDQMLSKAVQNPEFRVYLDSIGIVVVAITLGAEYGMICALLPALTMCFIDPSYIVYAPLYVAVAWLAGKLREIGGMSSIFTVVINGLVAGLFCALFSAPLNIVVFGFILETDDVLTQAFIHEVQFTLIGTFSQYGVSEPFDKVVTFVVAYLISAYFTIPRLFPKQRQPLAI